MIILCCSCPCRMPLLLNESLDAGDVSQAWLIWSGAAETALADACRFSGPAPNGGSVLGRGRACFMVVRLGGHKIRKVRGVLLMRMMRPDVFLYRDSSPLLDMRRGFKAAMDVLDSTISHAVTLLGRLSSLPNGIRSFQWGTCYFG